MRGAGAIPIRLRAAKLAVEAGADNITAHLREDRRHIRDEDIARLTAAKLAPLNLEMAVTPEMLAIALATRPHACCLVPERRQEITTEGGLDVASQVGTLTPFVAELQARRHPGRRCSSTPSLSRSKPRAKVGADAVEFHTGTYCARRAEGDGPARDRELHRLIDGARRRGEGRARGACRPRPRL